MTRPPVPRPVRLPGPPTASETAHFDVHANATSFIGHIEKMTIFLAAGIFFS